MPIIKPCKGSGRRPGTTIINLYTLFMVIPIEISNYLAQFSALVRQGGFHTNPVFVAIMYVDS